MYAQFAVFKKILMVELRMEKESNSHILLFGSRCHPWNISKTIGWKPYQSKGFAKVGLEW